MIIKQIRKGVFESNSSSSHSLTIDCGNRETPKLESYSEYDDPTTFILKGDHFGWEVREYNDFDTKLRYAYTLANPHEWGFEDNRPLEMLEEVLTDNVPGIEKFFYTDTPGYGYYVDHQSAYEMKCDIFACKDDLDNFLFSKNSILRTDNDNH